MTCEPIGRYMKTKKVLRMKLLRAKIDLKPPFQNASHVSYENHSRFASHIMVENQRMYASHEGYENHSSIASQSKFENQKGYASHYG